MKKILSFLTLEKIHYSQRTETKLLNLLYANLFKSIIAIIFNATLFIIVLWPMANRILLVGWYLLLIGITIDRFIDNRNFTRHHEHYDNETWHRHMTLGVSFSAVL